jgi:hypothetical protein
MSAYRIARTLYLLAAAAALAGVAVMLWEAIL